MAIIDWHYNLDKSPRLPLYYIKISYVIAFISIDIRKKNYASMEI